MPLVTLDHIYSSYTNTHTYTRSADYYKPRKAEWSTDGMKSIPLLNVNQLRKTHEMINCICFQLDCLEWPLLR